MERLREENSLLRKQLDSAQKVAGGDTELAVDRNANLQMTHTSDELTASDAQQSKHSEVAEQQVWILCWVLEYFLEHW